jgi:hypothetical protein
VSAFVIYTGPACPKCRVPLAPTELASGPQSCGRCGVSYEATVFVPPVRRARVLQVAEAGPSGASPCGAHPGNASVTNCDRCGVFMCGLCRIDADGQTLCPVCFERLAADGSLASTRVTFKDYTRMASTFAVFGLLFWPLAVVLGACGLYCGIRSLREKYKNGESEGWIGTAFVILFCGLQWVGSTVLLGTMFYGLLR